MRMALQVCVSSQSRQVSVGDQLLQRCAESPGNRVVDARQAQLFRNGMEQRIDAFVAQGADFQYRGSMEFVGVSFYIRHRAFAQVRLVHHPQIGLTVESLQKSEEHTSELQSQ